MLEAISSIRTVFKKWGEEIWLVNEPEYCCKFLVLRKDGQASFHWHKGKKETFIVLTGEVGLNIQGKPSVATNMSPAVTLIPQTPHSFYGLTDSIIMEISTHHDDNDVIREVQSNAPASN